MNLLVLREGCFFLQFGNIPNLDVVVMGTRGKVLPFRMGSQRFDRVILCFVNIKQRGDLVNHKILVLFQNMMFGLHISKLYGNKSNINESNVAIIQSIIHRNANSEDIFNE